jgi:hypothetical protein
MKPITKFLSAALICGAMVLPCLAGEVSSPLPLAVVAAAEETTALEVTTNLTLTEDMTVTP